MSGRNSVQRNQLTAIHIDTQWEGGALDAWAKLMTPAFLENFSGLQTLYATYHQDYNYDPYWKPGMVSLSMQNYYIEPCEDIKAPVKRMRVLPLKHVTVIMADAVRTDENLATNRIWWTVAQKREVADLLRRKLIDPDDHKLTADQIQAETAEARTL